MKDTGDEDNFLIIFIKYPRLGFVKTRLANDIGERAAMRLHRLFSEAVVDKIKGGNFRKIIFYTPKGYKERFKRWLGRRDLEFYPQNEGSLGERLEAAFGWAFTKGARRVIAIGSDCPLIEEKAVSEAFKKLARLGCVIGPALDGGYYLLGLRSFTKEIFSGIDWGTDKVLRQTLKILKNRRIKYGFLRRLPDVDNLSGLFLLKNILRRSRNQKINFTPLEINP